MASSRSTWSGLGTGGSLVRGAGIVTTTLRLETETVRGGFEATWIGARSFCGVLGQYRGVAGRDGDRQVRITVVMGADTAELDPKVEHGATRGGGGGDGLWKPARKPVCRILVGVLGIMSWMALDTNSSDVLKTLLTPLEI